MKPIHRFVGKDGKPVVGWRSATSIQYAWGIVQIQVMYDDTTRVMYARTNSRGMVLLPDEKMKEAARFSSNMLAHIQSDGAERLVEESTMLNRPLTPREAMRYLRPYILAHALTR